MLSMIVLVRHIAARLAMAFQHESTTVVLEILYRNLNVEFALLSNSHFHALCASES
jgi:hypothetical protein